jgi:hypothetical protein
MKRKKRKNMSKSKQTKQKSINTEIFIKTWQSSKSFADVLEALGVSNKYASARATSLRRREIELKKFRRTAEVFDVKALNELAKKSLKN